MKALVASLVTAVVVAGAAGAYVQTVTPAQVSSLEARVAALEQFKRYCLHRIHLSESPQGWMRWDQNGVGGLTPHAARFYGLPDTVVPHAVCVTG
jgi:hypothetical protein